MNQDFMTIRQSDLGCDGSCCCAEVTLSPQIPGLRQVRVIPGYFLVLVTRCHRAAIISGAARYVAVLTVRQSADSSSEDAGFDMS